MIKEKVDMKTKPFSKNVLIAGILFIVADLAGFLCLPFLAPMNSRNYLVNKIRSAMGVDSQ